MSIFSLFFLLTIITSPAEAQLGDGNRKGFLLGLGGVIGNTNIYYKSGSTDGAITYGANIYLGYGFNEQSILSFRYRWTWIDTRSHLQGLTWVADYKYFLSENGKFFLNGGLGPAMSIPEFGNPKNGFAFYGGLGYEVFKYVFLKADFTSIRLEDGLSGTAIMASLSFQKY